MKIIFSRIANPKLYYCAWFLCVLCVLSIGCARESVSRPFALNADVPLITPDSTKVDFILNPVFLQVSANQLVLINNKSEDLIRFLDLSQMRDLGTTVRTGSGPGEIPSPMVRNISAFGQDSTAVPSSVGNQVYMVAGKDHDISVRKYILPEGWERCQRILFLDSGLIFAQQGSLPMQWALFDNEGKIVFKIPDNLPAPLNSVDKGEDIEKMMVRTAVGVASKDAGHFAIAFQKYPEIRIYDQAGALVKTIIVADGYVSEKYAWFTEIKPLDNGFAVNVNDPGEGDGSMRSYIAIFNWNGNLTDICHLSVSASHFCIDEKTRMVYYTTYGDSDYIYHFKY